MVSPLGGAWELRLEGSSGIGARGPLLSLDSSDSPCSSRPVMVASSASHNLVNLVSQDTEGVEHSHLSRVQADTSFSHQSNLHRGDLVAVSPVVDSSWDLEESYEPHSTDLGTSLQEVPSTSEMSSQEQEPSPGKQKVSKPGLPFLSSKNKVSTPSSGSIGASEAPTAQEKPVFGTRGNQKSPPPKNLQNAKEKSGTSPALNASPSKLRDKNSQSKKESSKGVQTRGAQAPPISPNSPTGKNNSRGQVVGSLLEKSRTSPARTSAKKRKANKSPSVSPDRVLQPKRKKQFLDTPSSSTGESKNNSPEKSSIEEDRSGSPFFPSEDFSFGASPPGSPSRSEEAAEKEKSIPLRGLEVRNPGGQNRVPETGNSSPAPNPLPNPSAKSAPRDLVSNLHNTTPGEASKVTAQRPSKARKLPNLVTQPPQQTRANHPGPNQAALQAPNTRPNQNQGTNNPSSAQAPGVNPNRQRDKSGTGRHRGRGNLPTAPRNLTRLPPKERPPPATLVQPGFSNSPTNPKVVCPVKNCRKEISGNMDGHLNHHLAARTKLPSEWLAEVNRTVCQVCNKIVSTQTRGNYVEERKGYFHPLCRRAPISTNRPVLVFEGRPEPASVGPTRGPMDAFVANLEPTLLDENGQEIGDTVDPTSELREIFTKNVPVLHFIPKKAIGAVGQAFASACERVSEQAPLEDWLPLLTFAKTVLVAPPYMESGTKIDMAKWVGDRAKTFVTDGWRSLWAETLDDFPQTASVRHKSSPPTPGSLKWKEMMSKKVRTTSLSSAFKCLASKGVAKVDDKVVEKLKTLHPARKFAIRAPVVENPPSLGCGADHIEKAIKSFPKGSAPGPDGLRPQHLKDLLKFQRKQDPLKVNKVLCRPLNLLLSGKAPKTLAPFLSGANLIALNKDEGAIRPIAIGCTLRRLASKIVSTLISEDASILLSPTQVGVGISGGAEAIIEAVKAYDLANADNEDFCIGQVDYRNAFNEIARAQFIEETDISFPQISTWVRWCYDAEPELVVHTDDGHVTLESDEGCHQGDPLGPLLFCLAIKRITEKIKIKFRPQLNVWFFDDGTIAGDTDMVFRIMQFIDEESKKVGLELNKGKSYLYWPACRSDRLNKTPKDPFPSEFGRSPNGLKVLGAPIGTEAFVKAHLAEIKAKAGNAMDRLRLMDDPQAEFSLLRMCAGFCRITYLTRALDCTITRELAEDFDKTTLANLEHVLGTPELDNQATLQTHLPIREGGLGVRSAVLHQGAARLASINANRPLTALICSNQGHPSPDHSNPKEAIEFFAASSGLDDISDKIAKEREQKILSAHVDKATEASWSLQATLKDKARLNSCKGVSGNVILQTPGIKSLGTILTAHQFRFYLVNRLGLPFVFPEGSYCTWCKSPMDSAGYHAAICRNGPHRNRRHNAIASVVFDFCRKAAWQPTREVTIHGTQQTTVPGDVFLPRNTSASQAVAIDVTITHPLKEATLNQAAREVGAAAKEAELKKFQKHGSVCQEAGVDFKPFAVEFYGHIGTSGNMFLDNIAAAIASRFNIAQGPVRGEINRRLFFTLVKQEAEAVLARTPDPTNPVVF